MSRQPNGKIYSQNQSLCVTFECFLEVSFKQPLYQENGDYPYLFYFFNAAQRMQNCCKNYTQFGMGVQLMNQWVAYKKIPEHTMWRLLQNVILELFGLLHFGVYMGPQVFLFYFNYILCFFYLVKKVACYLYLNRFKF